MRKELLGLTDDSDRFKLHKLRAWHKKKYRLTEIQYNTLLLIQCGKCAICSEEGKLTVDHCHQTGTVRGLLCQNCNSRLGYFEAMTPEYMQVARQYLNRN